ncbi:hypothetical protein KSP39_PZI007892 [Platanthera zijinensis]|uniref:Uncharacterized protein n=1 Tax=Platanthera zijinensis TaxID=2320716 RepID=A0AAP0BME1_9ASPA
MAEDFNAVFEVFEQKLLCSLDALEQSLDNNFQRLIDSLPIIIEERISSIINPASTIIKDIHHIVFEEINTTSKPPMQVEYDFVLLFSITNIKSDYNVVLGEISLDQHVIKPMPALESATLKIVATKFTMNDQRSSKILVFDPGGISFIYMVTKTCIAI